MIGSAHESDLRSADRAHPAWLHSYADVLRDHLAEGRVVHLPVSGLSMWPLIDGGATLVVKGGGSRAIRPGDVVVYEDAGRLVCHRVLWRRRTTAGGALLTSGDNIGLPPVWVPPSALVGRVVAIEGRGVRRVLDAPVERVRALVVVGRAWAGLVGRRVTRLVRNRAMRARAA